MTAPDMQKRRNSAEWCSSCCTFSVSLMKVLLTQAQRTNSGVEVLGERSSVQSLPTSKDVWGSAVSRLTQFFEWNFLHRLMHSHHPSPPSLFRSRLPFLQIIPTITFLFFFRTDSTDSPDCLPILLSISVFHFLVFSVFHVLVVNSVR